MALKFRLHGTALAAALAFGFLGSAHAQFGGNTCVSLVTANQAMPAPATGTMSITNLDKYGVPAQACTNMTLNGTTSMNFEMTVATALRYNNVTMPACQGLAFGLNGGPVYSYTRANGSFALTVDVLELAVSKYDYVAGPKFSAADVYVGSQIVWGTRFGTLPKRPAFESYAARITARPAYIRANEIDGALNAEARKSKA